MQLVRRLFLCTALLLLISSPAFSQSPSGETVLHAAQAGKILPPSVFFRGQTASVQARNSGGVHFADGMYVLVSLVDNSGYSSGVQQKYQAYFITEVALDVEGHKLQPGAYGAGMVGGHFGVMDIGAHDLFSVANAHDAVLHRPSPLQVNPDTVPGHYRLYFGRTYVTFSRAR